MMTKYHVGVIFLILIISRNNVFSKFAEWMKNINMNLES